MSSKLENLKKMTTIVADTGDIEAIKQHKPQDATTNPSLLFKAAQLDQYKGLVQKAIDEAKKEASTHHEQLERSIVHLFVTFGTEILKIIPGRVSTEVDARLSFDVDASVKRAHEYIDLYKKAGIEKERVLIKLASTWEGIEAAKILEQEGIHCNMTLLFHLAQAIGAAEVNATLISPFVGRIYDWQKVFEKKDEIPADQDLGVQSVTNIYHYYKKFGHKTQIMGASFRNAEEILALAGIDLLTISPKLLDELESMTGEVERKLKPEDSESYNIQEQTMDEKTFRFQICDDPMATEKLYDGIRNFAKDTVKLENYIEEHFLGTTTAM